MAVDSPTQVLAPRQSPVASGVPMGTGTTGQLLALFSNPFSSQVQQTSFFASLGWSLGLGLLLGAGFILLRPRTSNVYAPRAKHADEKHRPPRLDKGYFSWVTPIRSVKEAELVEKVGLDATVFLRFLRMLRNMFLVLSVVGVGVLLPVNLAGNHSGYANYSGVYALMKFTPQYIFGSSFWAFVIVAYIFTGIIGFFLWWNYRAVLRLRRAYFASEEYRNSLHSRTLVITHIPQSSRTDDGLVRIVQEARTTPQVPRATVARNVRDLPELLEQHVAAVHSFEQILADYLRDPNKLPAQRPTCKPAKGDKAYSGRQKVDAIDYYTHRIHELETEIKQIRETVDQRNPLPFGFASYTLIEDAHCVAYASRKKGPQGTTIRLAPRPNDLIWKNLPMGRHVRRTKTVWGYVWMIVLTVLYIVPNALTSIFLADLAHLGLVWPAFKTSLQAHPTSWAIVQGILAPTVQTLCYLALPWLFRKILTNAGDTSRTQRERHVAAKLYSFFVFNNLFVFSVFAAVWHYVAAVVQANQTTVWDALINGNLPSKIFMGLCNVSPYWLTWQLQRNISAAVDIIQGWTLFIRAVYRRFSTPTPRQMIEYSAPQPFEYADYYNNYMFVATAGLAYATIQPLILPLTAFYIGIDYWLKKYLLQYVFITKTESGGVFWRMAFNRMIFATVLGNLVISLAVGANGIFPTMLYAMIPVFPIIAGFKWYCARTFDDEMAYVTTTGYSEEEGVMSAPKSRKRNLDRVTVRYGHPALYKQLMTPMVNAKAQGVLRQIYSGRLGDQDMVGEDRGSVSGFSDIYMTQMSSGKPGQMDADSRLPFELVRESECDFENFKRQQYFRDQFGGGGELYGSASDQFSSRPSSMGTMSTMMMSSEKVPTMRDGSPTGTGSRASSLMRGDDYYETSYPRGYHQPLADPPQIGDVGIPRGRLGSTDITATGTPYIDDEYDSDGGSERGRGGYFGAPMTRTSSGGSGPLLSHAAAMGRSPPTSPPPPQSGARGGAAQFARRQVGAPAAAVGHHAQRSSGSGGTSGRASPFQHPGAGARSQYPQRAEGGGYIVGDGQFGSGAATPTEDTPGEETSYDYFRRSRRT